MKTIFKTLIVLLTAVLVSVGCGESESKSNTAGYEPDMALVTTAWVNQLIEFHKADSTSAAPEDYPYERDHEYLIFETSWGPLNDSTDTTMDTRYQKGHVPGAIHSDSDIYENGDPMWFLLSDEQIFAAMSTMGISAEKTVVVYSRSPSFAARLWWILKYAGLKDVRFMDGGYEKWLEDGYAAETTVNSPVSATVIGKMNPDFIATVDYVAANYQSDNVIIADVRDYEEYTGETSGYDYVIEKGRIPGAAWFKALEDSTGAYVNADRTLKSLDEIKSLWSGLGLTQGSSEDMFNKEVIFYCGSGYRSALTFFYAYMMGYKNARNFSDGWEGWSTTYTYVGVENDCGANDGQKHGAWDSAYCQKPSGRPIETGEVQ